MMLIFSRIKNWVVIKILRKKVKKKELNKVGVMKMVVPVSEPTLAAVQW